MEKEKKALEDKGKELYLREKELEDRIKEYEKAMEELEVPYPYSQPSFTLSILILDFTDTCF